MDKRLLSDKNRDYTVPENFNIMRMFWCGKIWDKFFYRQCGRELIMLRQIIIYAFGDYLIIYM